MNPTRGPGVRRRESPRPSRCSNLLPWVIAALFQLSASPGAAQEGAPSPTPDPAPEPTGLRTPRVATSTASDSLPFAKNPIPLKYPAIGLGVGLAGNGADYSDLERGLTRMEDWYRQQGYPIVPHNDVKISPLMLWIATIRVSPGFELLAQFGGAKNGARYLRLTEFVLVARRRPFGSDSGSLFAGAGLGRYGFSWEQTYGNVVSPTDPNGREVLDYIRLTRDGSYFTGLGGVTFHASPSARLDLYAQYLGIKQLRLMTRHVGSMRVDLHGALFGARVAVYF